MIVTSHPAPQSGVDVAAELAAVLFDDLAVMAWTTGRHEPPFDLVHDDEVAAISHAVEARRRAFLNGRACLRRAASSVGRELAPVLRSDERAPRFAGSLVGSLSHTDGLVVGAVHFADDPFRLGVDVEASGRDLEAVVDRVLGSDERASVAGRSDVDELTVFSAKESLYKAQFQLTESWLGFEDVVATPLGDGRLRFEARTDVAVGLGVRWPVIARSAKVEVDGAPFVVTATMVEPLET